MYLAVTQITNWSTQICMHFLPPCPITRKGADSDQILATIWTIYIHAFPNFLEFYFSTCVLGFFLFKFTFLKKWRKVTRHLICLCLYTHRWILNNYGKQRRVPQSFRGATHSTAPPGKKDHWRLQEVPVKRGGQQNLPRNRRKFNSKLKSHRQKNLFWELFTVFHNMYMTISHNSKFYLPWDLAWTCEANQIPLLQLLQRPVRAPCEIYRTLKTSDMTVHFFQTNWEMQLLGTHKDQRLGSISVLLSARRLS